MNVTPEAARDKVLVNGIPKQQLFILEEFISLMECKPEMYKLEELQFYGRWIEKLGGKVPQTCRRPPNFDRLTDSSDEEEEEEPTPKETSEETPLLTAPPEETTPKTTPPEETPAPPEEPTTIPEEPTRKPAEPDAGGDGATVPEDEDVESDLELSEEGVIQDDDEDMPEYGDETLKVDENMIDQANEKKTEAMGAAAEGRLEDAVDAYTQAIKLNPTSAAMYAKRASIYLKMKKPKKAIHDCDKAIEHNSDSAQGYKWRGKANKMLGNWEEAYNDLTLACRLDYDDDSNMMLKDVTSNAKRIMEHRRKYERIREEKEQKKRKEKVKKAREDYERQKEQQSSSQASGSGGGFAGFPGAFPGSAGGMPGMPDLTQILNDPELLQAFQDPEVSQAFQDVAMNPANISKYENNPKVQRVINKMAKKFGGGARSGGASGDFPADPDVD